MRRARAAFIKKAIVSAVTAVAILCGTVMSSVTSERVLAKADTSPDVREPDTGRLNGKIVILHSNDVHGAVDGYARMAALRDDMVNAGAEVILADAGGFTGDETSDDDSSFKTIDGFMLMSSMDYAVATVSDAELQQGYDKLKNEVGAAKFRLLCSNVLKDEKSILGLNYLLQTESGVKIGFFGLSDPGQYDGLTVLSGSEMYDRARSQTESLKKDGADLVIGLTHIGDKQAAELYRNVDDIDFIIEGDSHSVMTEGDAGEPIQSGGDRFAYIGVIVIDKEGGIADHYLVKTEDLAGDDKTQDVVDIIKGRIGDTTSIGTLPTDTDDGDDGDDGDTEITHNIVEDRSDNTSADPAGDPGSDGNNDDMLSSADEGTYEVVKGDCLWNIAKKHLGDGSRWGEIYELNKGTISDPSLIYVGQQLVLPPG